MKWRVGAIAAAPPGVVNDLRPGDRILAMGGRPVGDWSDPVTSAGRGSAPRFSAGLARAAGRRRDHRDRPGPDARADQRCGAAQRSRRRRADARAMWSWRSTAQSHPIYPDCATQVEAAAGQAAVIAGLAARWRATASYTLIPKMQDLPAADGGYEQRWLIGRHRRRKLCHARTRAARPDRDAVAGAGADLVDHRGVAVTGMWAMVVGSDRRLQPGRRDLHRGKHRAGGQRGGGELHLVDRGAVGGDRVSEPAAGARCWMAAIWYFHVRGGHAAGRHSDRALRISDLDRAWRRCWH